MLDTPEKLKSAIKLEYRFLKNAAANMGFTSNKDYQRFRNTILGASRDYQVILALVKKYPKIDTVTIWSIDKSLLKDAKTHTNH
ncbi:MAG: hypothetical protein ABUK01_12245 [Leptospirales bacterium]